MAIKDILKRVRVGRPRHEPTRETSAYPELMRQGQIAGPRRVAIKPTPRNLRQFSKTPYARAAINAVKNPISMLDWEIKPAAGIEMNPELERQIKVSTYCFKHPNRLDSFRTLLEQAVEDYCISAGAIEMQGSGDQERPLWMYPVDGLTIQINPLWNGDDEIHYVQVPGSGGILGSGAVQIPLRDDELIYMRPNPSSATPFGLGPLEVAFTSISRLLGVGEFAGNVASNQRPSIALDLGNQVDPDKIAAFRSYWRDEVEGQGVMPVFGIKNVGDAKDRGPSVLRLYPEGDSGLMLEWQEFLKAEIAVAFDLSPMALGVERDVNRNTAEVGQDRDRDRAIKPVARCVEEHMTGQALHKKLGFYDLEFRFKGLDPEDEVSLSQVYQTEFEANAITPNEYRIARGRPPTESPWGDMFYADVQIAIQAARGAGQVDDPALGSGGKKPPAKPKPKPKPKGTGAG